MELSQPLNYAGDPREVCDQVAALESAGLDAVAYGYEKEAALIQELYLSGKKKQELYLSGKKKEAEAAVPDEFCELMSLRGPEGYVRDRIEAFREAGVTMLNVIPVGPDPARLISTVNNWL